MGLKDRIGLKYAISGLKTAYSSENNFKIHLIFTLFIILFSLFLGLEKVEWLFVLLAISLVLITELINSVIERLVDYLKPEIAWQAKEIKDISAGFVLIAAIFAAIIGFIIFIPKII